MRKYTYITGKFRQAGMFMLAGLMLCAPAYADDRQYKIEAAYLYSFFNYITWPGYGSPRELKSPVICISGADPIISYLEYIRLKMASERSLTIRAVSDESNSAGCHTLFVRHRISPRISSIVSNETLVVFKPDDPLDRGGMIELAEDGDRIAIKIDQETIEQRGFEVSSRLLDLARSVR